MITIDLKGGLGNQMFQYAYARARAKDASMGLNVYMLEHTAQTDTARSLTLNEFKLGPTHIIRCAPSLPNRIYTKIKRFFIPDWGYFQSEDFFVREATRIRQEFILRKPSKAYYAWEKQIEESPMSVSIHIRRGDYVHNPHVQKEFGNCSEKYYQESLSKISATVTHPTYFIFSDDLTWVKENLSFWGTTIYIEDASLSAGEELILMSKCQHHIVANSSFSWWGAWLDPRPGKIVIAPTPWFDNVRYNPRIIPDSWIQLPKN